MKPLAMALQAIVGTVMLVGCATPGGQQPEVKPVLAIHDGGAKADDYYQLGRYYQAKERFTEAAAAYRKAIALDRTLAEAHNALGAVYAAKGRFDEAFLELNAAIALDPTAAHIRNNLGYAYYLQGNPELAVVVFEAALALDPSSTRIWNNMGLALAQAGQTEKSAQAFARAQAFASDAVKGEPNATLSRRSEASVVSVIPEGIASPIGVQQDAAAAAAPFLRPVAPGESSAPAEVVRALARPVSTSAIEPMFEPVQDLVPPLVSLEPLPATDSPRLLQRAIARSDESPEPQLPMMDWEAPSGPALDLVLLESMSRIASPSLASLGAPMIPSEPANPEPAPLPTAVARNSEALGSPSGERSAGTIVFEGPSAATIVAVAPNAVELRWSEHAVFARPATAAEMIAPARFRFEVSNGNGVTGMARRIDGLLRAVGVPKARLTNQKPFVQPATEIQYRAGYEATAMALRAFIPGAPAVVASAKLRSGIDVRLVLGRDLPRDVALLDDSDAERRARSAD